MRLHRTLDSVPVDYYTKCILNRCLVRWKLDFSPKDNVKVFLSRSSYTGGKVLVFQIVDGMSWLVAFLVQVMIDEENDEDVGGITGIRLFWLVYCCRESRGNKVKRGRGVNSCLFSEEMSMQTFLLLFKLHSLLARILL